MSEVEQLMMVWRNPSTGEIYYPASYVERLRAALASIADSADFKDFAENEAAWMQGVARKALANSNAAETTSRLEDHENYCNEHGGHLRDSPACYLARERARGSQ